MIAWASAGMSYLESSCSTNNLYLATLGPALGPVIAGFSVQAKDWRWSQWEMLWLSGPIFVIMFFSLPETSAAKILLQRASRLRTTLGRTDLKSQSEIDQAHMTVHQIAFDALISK